MSNQSDIDWQLTSIETRMTDVQDELKRMAAAACMSLNEAFADALANRQIHWCRAKLLHALAGAADQGVLQEVLGEIFGDMHRSDNLDEDVKSEMLKYLKENGWTKKP